MTRLDTAVAEGGCWTLVGERWSGSRAPAELCEAGKASAASAACSLITPYF